VPQEALEGAGSNIHRIVGLDLVVLKVFDTGHQSWGA
jgi:hypothetical protein